MIFLPFNVPSLKNSKQISITGNKPVLLYSKTVKAYLRKLGIQRLSSKTGITEYKTRPNLFQEAIGDYFEDIPQPLILGLNFVRDTQRKFDFINAAQIVCDLLVAHGFVEDDDMKHLIPMPLSINGSWYSVCKDRPGVWLKKIDVVQEELKCCIYDRDPVERKIKI